MEYKVPRILWESLESVLKAQSKRYISELAKVLEVSEKELQRRVLPSSDELKIIIQDSQAESSQCKAHHQKNSLTIYCKKTVAYNSEYCQIHQENRMFIIENTDAVPITRVKDIHTLPPLWMINEEQLINSEGDVVGLIEESKQKITMFLIEED
jgi:hypothetical protein